MLDLDKCSYQKMEVSEAGKVFLSYLEHIDQILGDEEEAQSIIAHASSRNETFQDFIVSSPEELWRLANGFKKTDTWKPVQVVILWYLACLEDPIAIRHLLGHLLELQSLINQDQREAIEGEVFSDIEAAIQSWKSDVPDFSVVARPRRRSFARREAATSAHNAPTLVVLKNIGDAKSTDGENIVRRYQGILNVALPYKGNLNNIRETYENLKAQYPWAENVVDRLCNQLALIKVTSPSSLRLKIPPIMLIGSPGCGKTRISVDIFDALQMPFSLLPCGGTSDSGGLLPVPRGWSTSRACGLVQAVNENECANPGIILDELDKASTPENGGSNGNVAGALLSMTDGEKPYFDTCLLSSVDLSGVSFLATANDPSSLPEALKDRFMSISMPSPSPKHFPAIFEGMKRDEAKRLGVSVEALPKLESWQIDDLANMLDGNGVSIRKIRQSYQIQMGIAANEKLNMGMKIPALEPYLNR